jgi:hypothetical protein
MKHRLSALLLLGIILPATAQTIDPNVLETPTTLGWKLLNKQGIMDLDDLKREGERVVKKDGSWYDRQRVEVTGIWSIDEDTARVFPGMFDLSVRPSHLNEAEIRALSRRPRIAERKEDPTGQIKTWLWKKGNAVRGLVDKVVPAGEDLLNVNSDRNGLLTARAKSVLRPLQEARTRELVCHSWGTEMVYNAILEGYIKPPARLYVLAAPDNNQNKWKVLAERTGAEVIYVQSPKDLVIHFAIEHKEAAVPVDRRELEKLWNKYGHEPQRSPVGSFNDYSNELALHFKEHSKARGGHDRLEYYRALLTRFPSLQTSAVALSASQNFEADCVSQDILRCAKIKAAEIIEQAKAAAAEAANLRRQERRQAMKSNIESMKELVGRICSEDELLSSAGAYPHPMNDVLANFSQNRVLFNGAVYFANTGNNGSSPYQSDDLYEGLSGCELEIMKALYTKTPALKWDGSEEDERWAINIASAVRRRQGGRTTTGGDQGDQGAARKGSGSNITGPKGPAWNQLKGWR